MLTTFLTDKDDIVRYDVQSLTEEEKAQARENIRAAIDIYDIVSPEMFGAKGDGVTDDSQAFIDAFLSGKKVVCDSTKTYYFSNPIDVRTLTTGHLDGNNAHFINFHIYVNINDEFNNWRHAYSSNKFTIENMNFTYRQNGWTTLPEGWETPLITTGCSMIIRNIITAYPYVLATTDSYIDYMYLDSWLFAVNHDLFNGHEFNLDAISCLNKNGEYCRYDSNATPSAAGDSWKILQCNEFRISAHPDYNFMCICRRQPIFIENCVQSSFVIDVFTKVTFTSCHWENSFVTFKNDYFSTINFDYCYFYNNHIFNNDSSTTYNNCTFRAGIDTAIGEYPLSYMTNNCSIYDMNCKFIQCNFTGGTYISSDNLVYAKDMPKKTYNWRAIDYRLKLESKAASVREHSFGCQFPMIGDYVYDIYVKATSIPNIAIDYAQVTASITNIRSCLRSWDVTCANGGFSLVIIRTNPDGSMHQTEFYTNPNAILNADAYVKICCMEYGSHASFWIEGEVTSNNNVITPWVTITDRPTFTINESLYEANGALVTSDNSDAKIPITGYMQVNKTDTALSFTSNHPIQNKAVAQEISKVESFYHELVYNMLYKLIGEATFDGVSGQQIITSVKLFDEPKDFTIFIDATPSVDNYVSNVCLLDATSSSTKSYVGGVEIKTSASWEQDGFRITGNPNNGSITLASVPTSERTKMVVVYKMGLPHKMYSIKASDTDVRSHTISSNNLWEYVQHDGVVTIGAKLRGSEAFNGTIHDVEIYNYAFTEEEINERLTSDNYEPTNKLTLIPETSESDNNKFLTVANGSPTWTTLDAPSTSEFEELSTLVGDTAVSTQITNAMSGLATKYYVDSQRIAYTEYTPILPETTLIFTEAGVEDGIHLPQNLDLKAGATYLVNWNGTEYKCKCTEHGGGSLYLGNASYAAVDDRVDGEPFLILKASALPDFTDVIANVAGNHTLSVVEEVVHKIDEKYLPETSSLPEVTTDDNGAFLRVVDGVWTVEAIPNAEEATF